jgi:hypothetical protein
MPLLKLLFGLISSIVVLGVAALSVDYYDPGMIAYKIPDIVTQLVLLAVVGVSIFWTVCHVVGGGLLGMAAGGIFDGIKMGLLLGIGLGISRLWPHTLAWATGAFVAEGPVWHIVLLVVSAVVLFGLNSTMRYFWGSIQNGTLGR